MNDQTQIHDDAKSHGLRWLVVFVVLCVLTAVSFYIGNSRLMAENRTLGQGLMIAISICKALVVGLCFMHLWWERAWKFAVTIPAILIAVVLAISLVPDVGWREDRYSSIRQRFAPGSKSPSEMTPHAEHPSHEK